MRPTCVYHDRRGRPRCTECQLQIELCTCENPDEKAYERLTSPEGQFLAAVFSTAQGRTEYDRLFEKLVLGVGNLGIKLASNDNGEITDTAIKIDLANLAALLTVLAVRGTPEYPYPTS